MMDSPLHCRILVIDDEEHFRSFITQFLAKHGFEPLAAADGEQGLALARQTVPDLVLCDLELPGIDGYEVLVALQRDPGTAAIPVIFLTGRSEPTLVRFGMNLGADDYLTKPLDPEDLFHAIKARLARVCQRRRQTPPGAAPSRAGLDETFLIKTLKEKRLVKVRQLTHILAYGEYSWVYWEKGKGVMLRKALKQWLAELPGEQFIRVHRGAIVNLAYLDRLEKLADGRAQIRLRDVAEPIPVSLRLGPALNRKLQHLRLGNQVPLAAPACKSPLPAAQLAPRARDQWTASGVQRVEFQPASPLLVLSPLASAKPPCSQLNQTPEYWDTCSVET